MTKDIDKVKMYYIKVVVTYSLGRKGVRVVVNYSDKKMSLGRLFIHYCGSISDFNVKELLITTTCNTIHVQVVDI